MQTTLTLRTSSLSFIPNAHARGVSNLNPHADLAEFNGADVRPMNVRPLSKLLL